MSARKHRWNSIGRTRTKLAAKLTAFVQERYPGCEVLPGNIYAMRLAGKARRWEDAHSWEATVTSQRGSCIATLMSYSSMTECARADELHDIGDGEVSP